MKPKDPDSTLDYSGLSLSPEELADIKAMQATQESTPDPADKIEVSRKSMLRFPPKDSGLKIPRSLFLVTEDGMSSSFSPSLNFQAYRITAVWI
jgi:hypothetical protein